MTKDARKRLQAEPEPTEDFPEITEEMLASSVRGGLAEELDKGSNVVLIDEGLRPVFPSERAVNEALRELLPLVQSGRVLRIPECFPRERREQLPGYDAPSRTVVIHDDVTAVFRSPQAVNDALRRVAHLVEQVEARRAG
jgi:hypothetical protein